MIPAVLVCALGVFALYAAWSRRVGHRALFDLAGWGMIACSLVLWIRAAGAELGPVYAILVLPPAAWLLVLANTRTRDSREPRREPGKPGFPQWPALLRHGALFLAVVPLAALTSTLAALETASWLPLSTVGRVAYGVLLMPVIWGVLAYWVCADSRPLRPVSALVAAGAVSGALLLAG